MAEWVEIAATAIKNPGTASAVVPIPLTGPAEYIDKIKHIDFTLKIDEKTIERRDSAIRRLAMKLDMPSEIMLGMSQANHWSAWQIDEGALKAHIAPLAELICDSLTRGYLQPRLEASGEDPAMWVVWYDMSELALRPDRSAQRRARLRPAGAVRAALRREMGFDEDDAPQPSDLEEIGLKYLLRQVPDAAPAALDKLVGHKVLDLDADAHGSRAATGGQTVAPAQHGQGTAGDREQTGPPPTRDNPAAARPGTRLRPARSGSCSRPAHSTCCASGRPAGGTCCTRSCAGSTSIRVRSRTRWPRRPRPRGPKVVRHVPVSLGCVRSSGHRRTQPLRGHHGDDLHVPAASGGEWPCPHPLTTGAVESKIFDTSTGHAGTRPSWSWPRVPTSPAPTTSGRPRRPAP
jgi:hypothetical protein